MLACFANLIFSERHFWNLLGIDGRGLPSLLKMQSLPISTRWWTARALLSTLILNRYVVLLECQIAVGAAYKYHLLLLLILIIECAAGERSIVPVVGQVDFFNINNHATHRGQASLSHVPHSRQRG